MCVCGVCVCISVYSVCATCVQGVYACMQWLCNVCTKVRAVPVHVCERRVCVCACNACTTLCAIYGHTCAVCAMGVCMCMQCMCVHTHVQCVGNMCAHMCAMHVRCVPAHGCLCTHVHRSVCMHMYLCTHTSMSECAGVCMHVHVHCMYVQGGFAHLCERMGCVLAHPHTCSCIYVCTCVRAAFVHTPLSHPAPAQLVELDPRVGVGLMQEALRRVGGLGGGGGGDFRTHPWCDDGTGTRVEGTTPPGHVR